MSRTPPDTKPLTELNLAPDGGVSQDIHNVSRDASLLKVATRFSQYSEKAQDVKIYRDTFVNICAMFKRAFKI